MSTNPVEGRLTSGNEPLHVRRKGLVNAMRDSVQTIRTMLANWPLEYDLPSDHPVHELLGITEVICKDLETPNEQAS